MVPKRSSATAPDRARLQRREPPSLPLGDELGGVAERDAELARRARAAPSADEQGMAPVVEDRAGRG